MSYFRVPQEADPKIQVKVVYFLSGGITGRAVGKWDQERKTANKDSCNQANYRRINQNLNPLGKFLEPFWKACISALSHQGNKKGY